MVSLSDRNHALNSLLQNFVPAALAYELPRTSLFGTDGIRGRAGDLLTAPFAVQVGFWAGVVFQEIAATSGPVIIGQDSRNSSDMLALAIAAGLTAAGLEVWHLGLCPTPCVSYLTGNTTAIGGIMISASHNPPADNGIKFFSQSGTKLTPDLAQNIEAGLRGQRSPSSVITSGNSGKYGHYTHLVTDYHQALLGSLPGHVGFEGLKIILDLAWGAAAYVGPEVFQTLGAEVICLHDQPDGDRINVNCGSTHLDVLQAAIIEHQADLGFAFDGDADRVIAVDGKGRIVDGDYILYLWGKHLKEQNKLPNDLIIATVMANLGFERAWQNLGGQMKRTDVGDQHVQSSMWHTGAMLGGEQSGHILCHHHSYSGDGVQTALHLTALVQQKGISLAELVDESFQTYPQLLKNIRVEDRERRLNWAHCEPLQQAIALAEKDMGDRGRVLVRASGTEPVIRVMVEAETETLVNYWTEHLVAVVESYFVH